MILFFIFTCIAMCVVYAELSPYPDCPRGTFRESPFSKECTLCAKGYYGETHGLVARTCSGACPLGRYSDLVGLKTIDECKLVSTFQLYCPLIAVLNYLAFL